MSIAACIERLKERKRRVESGQVNCIPIPFTRFRNEWPGIEKKRYYIVTAQTKGAKTQFASFVFVYDVVFYAFEHPNIHPKIFYYNLEEEEDEVLCRWQSYILYRLTDGRVRIDPTDLQSTDERKPLPDEVLALLESEEFKKIDDKFEEVVQFMCSTDSPESYNPTGIWKTMRDYLHTTHEPSEYKTFTVKENGRDVEKTIPIKWRAKDPEAYEFLYIDHIGLIDTESGKDLRESILKLSKYCISLRNLYEMTVVVVQQQSTETASLDAFKAGKIRPTRAGLADCKDTGKDCNMIIGITNPYAFELTSYLGYDISKLQDRVRFMEIVVNRNGRSNGICPLYFDGAVNYFKELPSPKDKERMQLVYDLIDRINKASITLVSFARNLFNLLHK